MEPIFQNKSIQIKNIYIALQKQKIKMIQQNIHAHGEINKNRANAASMLEN